jgi:hypothetical protein
MDPIAECRVETYAKASRTSDYHYLALFVSADGSLGRGDVEKITQTKKFHFNPRRLFIWKEQSKDELWCAATKYLYI